MILLLLQFFHNTYSFLVDTDRKHATSFYAGYLVNLLVVAVVTSYFIFTIGAFFEDSYSRLIGTEHAVLATIVLASIKLFLAEFITEVFMYFKYPGEYARRDRNSFGAYMWRTSIYCSVIIVLSVLVFVFHHPILYIIGY